MIRSTIITGCAFGAIIGLYQTSGTIDTFNNPPLQPISVVIPTYTPQQQEPQWAPPDLSTPVNVPADIPEPTSTACEPGIIKCGVLKT